MDRSWIELSRLSEEYQNGVEQFLEFAKRNVLESNAGFYCPCVNCLNQIRLPPHKIREHTLCDGFLQSYTKWIWHGEVVETPSVPYKEVEIDMEDQLEDMIRDIGEESFE